MTPEASVASSDGHRRRSRPARMGREATAGSRPSGRLLDHYQRLQAQLDAITARSSAKRVGGRLPDLEPRRRVSALRRGWAYRVLAELPAAERVGARD